MTQRNVIKIVIPVLSAGLAVWYGAKKYKKFGEKEEPPKEIKAHFNAKTVFGLFENWWRSAKKEMGLKKTCQV